MSKSRDSRKAIELVQQYIPAGGSMLEVSSGHGAKLSRLKALGYKVRGTNFSKYEDVDEDVDVDNGGDIMKTLPYEDNAFDAYLCLRSFGQVHTVLSRKN
jgi:ubiquinone/menaquinone biosynthesis C-methylase UbiE